MNPLLTRDWQSPESLVWRLFDEVDELLEKAREQLKKRDEAGVEDFVDQAHRRLTRILEEHGQQVHDSVVSKIGQTYGIPAADIPRTSPEWLSFL